MLRNGFKTNRSNKQKNKFAHAARFFVFPLPLFSTTTTLFCTSCFVRLQRCFVQLKRQTSYLHIIFMEELSYVLTQYFSSCVHVIKEIKGDVKNQP